MTDLRTAAQAVIDIYDRKVIIGVLEPVAVNCIEALRQALAEPAEPVATIFFSGPIGYFWVDTLEMGERILHYMKVDDDDWTATNTAPPSVDALIAEIDGLGVHTFPNQSSEEFVRLKKLKGIVDKYRGSP